MSRETVTDEIFFNRAGLDRPRTEGIVADALHGADDGELFLEYRQSESFSFDDGRLKNASFDTRQGFGLRAVSGETTAFAHAGELSEEALKRATATVPRAVRSGHGGAMAEAPSRTNRSLYVDDNPLDGTTFDDKVALLAEIDAYARAKEPRVRQVMGVASRRMAGGGDHPRRRQPCLRRAPARAGSTSHSMVGEGERQETGSQGVGGRAIYDEFLVPERWQAQVDEALRQALVNLESVATPAGEVPVVLGPGLARHPAPRGRSATASKATSTARRPAPSPASSARGSPHRGVTVVDDGTIDRSPRLAHGRRRGHPHRPHRADRGRNPARLPAGPHERAPDGHGAHRQRPARELCPRAHAAHDQHLHARWRRRAGRDHRAGVKKGIYAKNFSGGQVDITSGKFVFSAAEAYLIEDGKTTAPLKGASLIGNGPDVLTRVAAIGNDFRARYRHRHTAARTARACRSASACPRCLSTRSP